MSALLDRLERKRIKYEKGFIHKDNTGGELLMNPSLRTDSSHQEGIERLCILKAKDISND